MPSMPYRVAFFDIGDTLGHAEGEGRALQLHPFATTVSLLESFGAALGLRLGIITNSGSLGPADISGLLERAGLKSFFEPGLIVTSAEVGAKKPEAKIYDTAAERAGVPLGQCLYIGDAASEVEGAQRAGMGGLLKPVPT